MTVANQQFARGSNRAPVQRAGAGMDSRALVKPPQTIISLPVQMAVCPRRGLGAPSSRVVDTQEFCARLKRPPVFRLVRPSMSKEPPQTIISLPVQTAVWPKRGSGAPLVGSAAQVFEAGMNRAPVSIVRGLRPPLAEAVISGAGKGDQRFSAGSYLAPVLTGMPVLELAPPQMIISVPVQTAVWRIRGAGAPGMGVATRRSVVGLYWKPVLIGGPSREAARVPPQTTISLPVQMAV